MKSRHNSWGYDVFVISWGVYELSFSYFSFLWYVTDCVSVFSVGLSLLPVYLSLVGVGVVVGLCQCWSLSFVGLSLPCRCRHRRCCWFASVLSVSVYLSYRFVAVSVMVSVSVSVYLSCRFVV